MTHDQILKFMNENPVFFLATCVGNEPRVRVMRLYRAGSHGVVFNTSHKKDLHRQLQANPCVELCFYNEEEGTQIRIRGKAEHVRNPRIRNEMAENNPALASVVLEKGPDELEIYRLIEGKVKLWQMDEDFTPRLMSNTELSSIWMAMFTGTHSQFI